MLLNLVRVKPVRQIWPDHGLVLLPIVNDLMHLPFAWLPLPALAAALAAVVVTIALGLIGTFSALGQKPAPVLRNL